MKRAGAHVACVASAVQGRSSRSARWRSSGGGNEDVRACIGCTGVACAGTDQRGVSVVLGVRGFAVVGVVADQATATAHLDRKRVGLQAIAT